MTTDYLRHRQHNTSAGSETLTSPQQQSCTKKNPNLGPTLAPAVAYHNVMFMMLGVLKGSGVCASPHAQSSPPPPNCSFFGEGVQCLA